MEQINEALLSACKELFDEEIAPELTIADSKFGDYSSNVAMRIASQKSLNAREVAQQLCKHLGSSELFSCEPAGPGFINFKLNSKFWTDEVHRALSAGDSFGKNQLYKSKTIVAEYSDPNPFKTLHAGHLYTSVVGDAISNLFENSGAKVYRVNFGGDIGRHVAITIYSILIEFDGEHPEKLKNIPEAKRTEWLSQHYVNGTNIYEDDESTRDKIQALNKKLYEISQNNDHESALAQIYWQTREWSYDYLKDFYKRIGSYFDKYYPESETAVLGMTIVKEGLKTGVFKNSEGAVVFEGEEHGLHTRVFINSQGLPTYETKDLGLMYAKKRDYNPDISIVITGNEQADYMKVVLSAMNKIDASLATRTKHVTHGMVKLKGGQKMSSRKGNILGADEVLEIANKTNKELNNKEEPDVVLGAVKYSFIKQRIGADIIFDPVDSISLHGNSGPYIQYAHARAQSILSKSNKQVDTEEQLRGDELELAKKIMAFEKVLLKSAEEILPNQVCTYLYELAQEFNRFYEHNRVLDDEREMIRLKLVKAYQQVIKNGLGVLSIKAPNSLN
jgi:arginyl-tRNA synthetase